MWNDPDKDLIFENYTNKCAMDVFEYLIIYSQQLQRCIFDPFLVRTVVHQLEAELRCLKMRKGK